MVTAELNVVEDARRAAKSRFSYYHQVMKDANMVVAQALPPSPPKKATSPPKQQKK